MGLLRAAMVGAALRRRQRRAAAGAAGAGVAPSFAYDDIPDLAAVYSMRRTLTSYDGALIRLRRDSDDDELGIGADGEHLDTATAADFLNGADGFITTWYDQSGSEHDATQATASEQPLYVPSGQNGRPVARFDGVDDRLVLSGDALDIFRNAGFGCILAVTQSNAQVNEGYTVRFSTTSIASVRFSLGANFSNNRFATRSRRLNSNSLITVSSDTHHDSNWHLLSAIADWANGDLLLYQDGALAGSGSVTAGNSDDTGSDDAAIGASGGGANAHNGDIAEVLLANVPIDREAAENAAASYWGVYA